MGLISQATGAIYIGDFNPNGSDLSSAFQARSSDPFVLKFKGVQIRAKGHWTLGAAAFLSLHRTGQRFGVFKPNGTEVAKKGPGRRGVGGEVHLPPSLTY